MDRKRILFDIECNGLDPSKIHCLYYYNIDTGEEGSLVDYKNMAELVLSANWLIGHNIIRYDIPVLERLLDIKINKQLLVDTLALSWYIYYDRHSHSLDSWGADFLTKKVKVEDWEYSSKKLYIDRARSDVMDINLPLWRRLESKLLKLYGSEEEALRLIEYLSFKMYCARLQEESGWKLDMRAALAAKDTLQAEVAEKNAALRSAMPENEIKINLVPPTKIYKQDGTPSVLGHKWLATLEKQGLPKDHKGPIQVVKKIEAGNPSSPVQIKNWLFSLGWVPDEFKFVKEDGAAEVRKIPQVYTQVPGETGVTQSVRLLFDKEPNLEYLDGLTVARHRLAIIESLLKAASETGYVKAGVAGLTNTLRFKHSELVNLPGVHKLHGSLIRGSLIAPIGKELAGADMVAVEDKTKQHYIYQWDPEYVREVQKPGFDPHLDIALQAKLMDSKMVDEYKQTGAHSSIRRNAKTVNYSCTYGAMPPTIARSTGLDIGTAEVLHKAYWERNWAVKEVAKNTDVKTIDNEMWLFNPVSKLWYSLRHEKDIFSTLNQSTAVWCFDTWIKYVLSVRPQLTAQFHDEGVWTILLDKRKECEDLLNWAIKKTNEELKLNVELMIDIKFGSNYAEIH